MSLQMTVPSCASMESFTRSVPLAMAQHQPVTPMISCFILLMLLPLGQNSSPSAEVSSCSSAEDLTVCLDKLRQAVAIRLCRWLRAGQHRRLAPAWTSCVRKKDAKRPVWLVIFVESSLTQQATLPGEFDSGGSNHVILYVFNVYDVYDIHSVYGTILKLPPIWMANCLESRMAGDLSEYDPALDDGGASGMMK